MRKFPQLLLILFRPKDVKFRKGKRRGLSLREALEEEEREEGRRRRAKSIEQSRLERHNALFQPQASNQQPQEDTDLSDQDLSDGPQGTNDVPAYESEDNKSDNDIQYLGTQARSPSPVPSLNRSDPIPDPEISESDSDDLVDIDKLLSQQVPPPLVSLSQNLTTSQLPPSTAPMMTRTARGVVRKKTFEPQRMESQELRDAQAKIENKRQRQARKEVADRKKQAKSKQARKEDISQLELSNRFALLSSSPPEED